MCCDPRRTSEAVATLNSSPLASKKRKLQPPAKCSVCGSPRFSQGACSNASCPDPLADIKAMMGVNAVRADMEEPLVLDKPVQAGRITLADDDPGVVAARLADQAFPLATGDDPACKALDWDMVEALYVQQCALVTLYREALRPLRMTMPVLINEFGEKYMDAANVLELLRERVTMIEEAHRG